MFLEVFVEPGRSELRDLIKRARFLKKMSRARDDCQFLFTTKLRAGCFVQAKHQGIGAADDQKRWRLHVWEGVSSEVWSSAARHHGANDRSQARGRHESGAAPGARPEITERQLAAIQIGVQPFRGREQTVREELNVEAEFSSDIVLRLFCSREQIEEKRADTRLTNDARHELVARGMPAAPAAMNEKDNSAGIGWNVELAFQMTVVDRDPDYFPDLRESSRGFHHHFSYLYR